MPKKRKLNSKNPKYLPKSIKKVLLGPKGNNNKAYAVFLSS